MSSPNEPRVAYVHVGAHKTGTTSIQALLAANESTFRATGVFLPQAGRIDPASAGHHNIAWELGHDRRFNAAYGSFADALDEIAACSAPIVCLTSEDFELMHADRAALQAIRDGLAGVGYETRAILYVRPQADYLESLYATIVHDWDVVFSTFVDNLIGAGIHGSSCFEYDKLADALADVFGRRNMIVRAYDASRPAPELLQEFATTLCSDLDFQSLVQPPRLNRRVTFSSVLASRSSHIGSASPSTVTENEPFDPLSLLDLIRIGMRFSGSNARLRRTYGASIPVASKAIIAREVLTALLGDREAYGRKQLLRALDDRRTPVATARRFAAAQDVLE
jgi:hypothetical protein